MGASNDGSRVAAWWRLSDAAAWTSAEPLKPSRRVLTAFLRCVQVDAVCFNPRNAHAWRGSGLGPLVGCADGHVGKGPTEERRFLGGLDGLMRGSLTPLSKAVVSLVVEGPLSRKSTSRGRTAVSLDADANTCCAAST